MAAAALLWASSWQSSVLLPTYSLSPLAEGDAQGTKEERVRIRVATKPLPPPISSLSTTLLTYLLIQCG
eukprot:scaffold488_cov142-Skeletonema_menzelii.AAC.18